MSQTFNCPNCGAPLDYQGSDPIIRCPYCSSSVIVPENLRAKPQFSSKRDNFTLGGSGDMGGLVNQARRIKQVKDLAEAGEMDQAVAIYREITGADEFSARQSVGALAMGQPITFSGLPAVSVMGAPSIQVDAKATQGIGRAIGCFVTFLTLTIIAGVLIPILASLGVFAAVLGSFDIPVVEVPGGIEIPVEIPGIEVPGVSGFATQELSFGGEGTGPGLFGDVRAIGVDPTNGNIYAANYDDGRVQAFDATGKFITQWIIPEEVSDPYFGDMAVGRDGTIYIPVFGKLKLFDGEGQAVGEIDLGRDYIDNLDIAPDGTLVAIANGEDIVWLTPEGEIKQRVDEAISTVSGDSELDTLVAVDGLGNVYALGTFNNAVFVFDSKGKYVNRFGSDGDEQGQFRAPLAIEVDGQGRIFVSDIKGVQVFSNDGRFIDVLKVKFAVAYGLAFDDQGKLYLTTGNKTVEKYSIKE